MGSVRQRIRATLPLPASLYRIQRREYYRFAIPHSERLRCVIPVNDPQAGSRAELPVLDISGGGIQTVLRAGRFRFVLWPTYAGGQIGLPEVGKIEVTIRVKNLISASPKSGQTITRVRCEFVNLDNAPGILLQRYVTKMQRLKADI